MKSQLIASDISNKAITTETTGPSGNRLTAVISSTAILLVLFLLAFELFVASVKPLQYIPDKKYRPMAYNAWVSKIPIFFDSNSHPQTIIIGSSLPMAAFSLFDRIYAHCLPAGNSSVLDTYTDSHYFEHGLKQDLGLNGSVKNLTIAGCMVSESYLLLKRLVETGRKPQFVIYGIAPRDFVDNEMPHLWQSPLYEVLGEWECASHISNNFPKGSELGDFVFSSLSRYYRSRKHYRDILMAVTGDVLGHPISLYAAGQTNEKVQRNNDQGHNGTTTQTEAKSWDLSQDLEDYKRRYLPLNVVRFADEKVYFKKLVDLCANNNIKLIVVKMPLTKANRSLIPKGFKGDYDQFLDSTQLGGKFHLLDLCQSSIFLDSDFSDSVHLNETGSRKFQDTLLAYIKNTI